MKQTQKKTTKAKSSDGEQVGAAAPQTQDHVTDELLDAIDEVLETNSEEFVRGYIQKGGQ